MKKLLFLLLILLPFTAIHGQIHDPIKWSFSTEKISETKINLIFTAKIDNGWHLYGMQLPQGGPESTSFVFDTIEGGALQGIPFSQSKLHSEFDPLFELNLSWYTGVAVFKQTVILDKADLYYIKGGVHFMGCNNENCLPPSNERFTFGNLKNITAQDPDTFQTKELLPFAPSSADLWNPVVGELKAFGGFSSIDHPDTSIWQILLMGFLGGLLALLTPCVWPLIPMTVSFFLKRSQSRRKAVTDSLLYGIAIVLIYVGLGLLITILFGAGTLNDLATNALFNLIFFAVLVIFAISFFGGFELMLPSSWTNKIDQKADSTGGFISILLMAFTLALVSFSCTGPIIGNLLVLAATMGDLTGPAIGMFGFALALAIPFTLFALFPTWLKGLPRSGGWLNIIKVTLGFIELALALKFLSVADLAYGWGILDREVFLVLWIVIFAMMGLYFLGKIAFPHDDTPNSNVTIPRFFLALLSFSFALYMVPGLWGAPLKAISAFTPPLTTQDFNLYEGEVHAEFTDFEEGMTYARREGKPVLIDFSGYGCVNCRKMEASVWTDPKVKNKLDNDFVLITLIVDDKSALKHPLTVVENGKEKQIKTIGEKWSYLQRHKFGANAQPYYVIVDPQGKPLAPAYSFDESVEKYLNFLNTGLTNFKKNR